MSTQEFVDVSKLTLEEWLHWVFNPPPDKLFLRVAFPTDDHRDEYLSTITTRSEAEVYRLLDSFLIHTGSIKAFDELALASLIASRRDAPDLYSNMLESTYFRRLVLYESGRNDMPPWEGLTWIFDLLPFFPKEALAALNAYTLAHAQFLPDMRYSGLHDAMEVIRAKFIGMPGSRNETVLFLRNLAPREFEHLVERLYDALGYKTELTPASKDGGRDVVATKEIISQRERLLIECKLYAQPVGVELTRSLLGVVSSEKVNKGVIVTTSQFTRGARKFSEHNPRIELINGDELVGLMNEHLGPRWSLHIERLVGESKAQHIKLEQKL